MTLMEMAMTAVLMIPMGIRTTIKIREMMLIVEVLLMPINRKEVSVVICYLSHWETMKCWTA